MDIIDKNGYSLRGLSRINVLLGKNGCGKSTALKQVEAAVNDDDDFGRTKYVTPERGGTLKYEPNVENSMVNSKGWFEKTRRANQFTQFREQTVVQYRKLQSLVQYEIETIPEIRSDLSHTFDTTVSKINALLDNIEFRRKPSDFELLLRGTGEPLQPGQISSGESELISLAIECLVFDKECASEDANSGEQQEGEGQGRDKENALFLDEPDVHLHPDLQARFATLLKELADDGNLKIIIATHSTALLAAFHDYEHVSVAFMGMRQTDMEFRPVTEVTKRILPVFGAHPLSNVFNESPVLLVEGEDDERVWQQAVRSSNGQLKLFPRGVDAIQNLKEHEDEVVAVLNAVYDNATAYSLRDRDEVEEEEIQDDPPLIRMRFSCRAAENLILSDNVLQSLGTSWEALSTKIDAWIDANAEHVHHAAMVAFKESGYDRKRGKLKELRNDLMGVIGSSKPWEVAVGQVIGGLQGHQPSSDHDIRHYLGTKVVGNLIPE